MKGKHVAFLIVLILLVDQASKIYIKTHFDLHQSKQVLGQYFQLFFVENRGMAYGLSFGGEFGKYALSVFRLIAVIFGVWYIRHIIAKKMHKGFIICVALIFTGALGNLLDSMFYGLIFDRGMLHEAATDTFLNYDGLAQFGSKGYAGFMQGNVVDMLYFPLFKGHFPTWFPFVGGESFEFFRYIFNVADMAISIGVISMFVFQKRFVNKQVDNNKTVETKAIVTDETQVS